MECLEKEDIEIVNAMGLAATHYGKVRKIEGGIYDDALVIEIGMFEVAGDIDDTHTLQVLKTIPQDRGYKVACIESYDSFIQFTLKRN